MASRLRLICSSLLDQAALYGTGPTQNQPIGVISASGSQAVSVATPPTWGDITKMRYLATDYSVPYDSFGWIVSPLVRQGLEATPRFTQAGTSIWDAISPESQVSKEISIHRVFGGVWRFCVLGFWGGTPEEPGADLTVDAFSQAEKGLVLLTVSLFADVGILWPQLFVYSQANAVLPPT